MANNWPDGGEQLTRGEKLTLGVLGALIVGGAVATLLLMCLRLFGPVSWPVGIAAGLIGLTAGALWVRPWETGPPRRR